MKDLIEYLQSIVDGPITDTSKLEHLLAACWHEFDGHEFQGMEAYKLINRIENADWESPKLYFTIERHGRTVSGSTRADLHRWQLDVVKRKASCWESGFRQVAPLAPRVNVKPISEEIVRLIINQEEDERLKWYKDGSVRVLIGKIFPEGSAYKQTLEGIRRRFREATDISLTNLGWTKIRANKYIRSDSDTTTDNLI